MEVLLLVMDSQDLKIRKKVLDDFLSKLPECDVDTSPDSLDNKKAHGLLEVLWSSAWWQLGMFKYVERLVAYGCEQMTMMVRLVRNITLFHDWAARVVLDLANGKIDLKESLGADYITTDHKIINALCENFRLDEDNEDLFACFNKVKNTYGVKHYITRYAWCARKKRNADVVRAWLRPLPAPMHHAALLEYNSP